MTTEKWYAELTRLATLREANRISDAAYYDGIAEAEAWVAEITHALAIIAANAVNLRLAGQAMELRHLTKGS